MESTLIEDGLHGPNRETVEWGTGLRQEEVALGLAEELVQERGMANNLAG